MSRFAIRRMVAALLTLPLLLSGALLACGEKESDGGGGGDATSGAARTTVRLSMRGLGDIDIELYPEEAPLTVANFERLVREGFYDGLTIHRVVPGFVIQGGDPNGDGFGGSKDKIKGEFSSNGVENNLSHRRGVVSMARSNDPDSASSQFFIVLDDSAAASLDGSYAAFGKVIEGMDVVDEIAAVSRDGNDKPLEDVVIAKAEIIKEASAG